MSSCSAPDRSQPPAGRISSRSATGSASTRKASSSTSWTAARWFRAAKKKCSPRGKWQFLPMSNELPALLQIFCVTIPPICWVQTKKASRSAPSSASKPVQSCTMPFWMGLIPLRPERSLRFLTIGSPKKHRSTRYWLTAGRISPETPTFCSTMKGRRAASCPLKMKRSERHGSSTTAALRPTLRWSSVS